MRSKRHDRKEQSGAAEQGSIFSFGYDGPNRSSPCAALQFLQGRTGKSKRRSVPLSFSNHLFAICSSDLCAAVTSLLDLTPSVRGFALSHTACVEKISPFPPHCPHLLDPAFWQSGHVVRDIEAIPFVVLSASVQKGAKLPSSFFVSVTHIFLATCPSSSGLSPTIARVCAKVHTST